MDTRPELLLERGWCLVLEEKKGQGGGEAKYRVPGITKPFALVNGTRPRVHWLTRRLQKLKRQEQLARGEIVFTA